MSIVQDWPVSLIKNEFCKDYGVRLNNQRNRIHIIPLGRTEDGDYFYEVTYPGLSRMITENWALMRRSVGLITKKHIVLPNPDVHRPQKLITEISKKCGYELMVNDLGKIQQVEDGWEVSIHEDSLRFFGSFIIFNK